MVDEDASVTYSTSQYTAMPTSWKFVLRPLCYISICFHESNISICFHESKEIWKEFSLPSTRWRAKLVLSVRCAVRGDGGSTSRAEWGAAPSAFSRTVLQPRSLKLHLWRSVLCLHSFRSSMSRCVLRHQKSLREVNFRVWECLKIFSYKLIVIVSSLYVVSPYKFS